MLRKCSWAVVAIAGFLGSASSANAAVIDTFSGQTNNAIIVTASNTSSLTFGAVGASAGIFGDRQGAIQNGDPFDTSSIRLQPGGTEGAVFNAISFTSSTFYLIYGAAPGNSSLTGLTNGGAPVDLTAGGATGILLKSLANNSVATIGITLFNAAGTIARTIYYNTVADADGADYFFSFQNWAGGGVSVGSVGGMIVSITNSAVSNNSAYFLDPGVGFDNISTVATAPAGAIIITPEPASFAMWSGLLLFGCAFWRLRRQSVSACAFG